jgi:primosomal protein N'
MNCKICTKPNTCDCLCSTCSAARNTAFQEGWDEADEAIKHQLPGYKDFSQGETEWDKGWNSRLSFELR